MAANGRGQMRPNSGGRTPPFVIIGLLVVIGILAFNYWNLTSKNSLLGTEVEELGIKYRSSMKKYEEVDKLYRHSSESNIEFKQQNEECRNQINKNSEQHAKETEDLTGRLENLAQEQESTKNDLNACDDEVGFCRENITRQVISHRKQLDDVQSRCRLDIDEAKSAAERRAADVEVACQASVEARRLSILRGIQQVFGTKAVILLEEHTKLDISGIDLNIQDSNTVATVQKVGVQYPQGPVQAQVYPQNPDNGQQVVAPEQVNQGNIQPPQSQEQVQPPQDPVQPPQDPVQPPQDRVQPPESQEQVQPPQEQVQLLQAPQQDANAPESRAIDNQNEVVKGEEGINPDAFQNEEE